MAHITKTPPTKFEATSHGTEVINFGTVFKKMTRAGKISLALLFGAAASLYYFADQHENKRLHQVAQDQRQNLVGATMRAEKGLPNSVKHQFRKAVSEVSRTDLETGSKIFASAKHKDILTAKLDKGAGDSQYYKDWLAAKQKASPSAEATSDTPYYKEWTAYASEPDKKYTDPMRANFFLTSEAIAPTSTDMAAIRTAFSKLDPNSKVDSAYKFSLTGYFDTSVDGRPKQTDSLDKRLAFYKAAAAIHTETAYIAYPPDPNAGAPYYGPITKPKYEPIIFVKKADGSFEKLKTDAELTAEKTKLDAAKEAAERKASIERFRMKDTPKTDVPASGESTRPEQKAKGPKLPEKANG